VDDPIVTRDDEGAKKTTFKEVKRIGRERRRARTERDVVDGDKTKADARRNREVVVGHY
jgi:hypothetical protein